VIKSATQDRPTQVKPGRYSQRIYFKLNRADIALFKFLLECYDNLAYMSVINSYDGVVQLNFSPDQQEDVQEVLDCISREVNFTKRNVAFIDADAGKT